MLSHSSILPSSLWSSPLRSGLLALLGHCLIGLAPGQEPLSEQEAVEQLDWPAITINLERQSVDIDALVSLRNGMLELIACSKGSKEHESIVCTEALPSHIHASLLLLRAKPGNPAKSELIDPTKSKWQHTPPTGSEVEVYLVVEDEEGHTQELGIDQFIRRFSRHHEPLSEGQTPDKSQDRAFPTKTFLFAGSEILKRPEHKPLYICDNTGNLISIVTFGDEVLCLPEINPHSNSSLVWEVEPLHLPPLGTKVTLRLVPKNDG